MIFSPLRQLQIYLVIHWTGGIEIGFFFIFESDLVLMELRFKSKLMDDQECDNYYYEL